MNIILCILDGWGYRKGGVDNAIAQAQTPHWDDLLAHFPHTLLQASETTVGLPPGQMGNSEVGHMTMGAGRILFQDLVRIDQAIESHTLDHAPPLLGFINSLKKSGGTCHLLGLLSPGGVHSHERHLLAIAALCANQGIPVALHGFLDGRDCPPQSAEASLLALGVFLDAYPLVSLATLGGRYYGMDRDNRWERVQRTYVAMVQGHPHIDDALAYLRQNYDKGITDEFIPPAALGHYKGIQTGDGLLMAHFRADRARQILTALLDPSFEGFERESPLPLFADVLGLTDYGKALSPWMETLFPPVSLQDGLGECLSRAGKKQLRIGETEKYAHVTFFFNGGKEEVFPGEDRILIPSPQVATYDLKPEMSAFEITDHLVDAIHSQKYTLIVANYANTDMVGHTGNFTATCHAVETIDTCLGRLKAAVQEAGACLLITADHGNAEQMCAWGETVAHTAHTLNPVPFLMVNGPQVPLHPGGALSDIAPTILDLLKLPQPLAMTGLSLLDICRG